MHDAAVRDDVRGEGGVKPARSGAAPLLRRPRACAAVGSHRPRRNRQPTKLINLGQVMRASAREDGMCPGWQAMAVRLALFAHANSPMSTDDDLLNAALKTLDGLEGALLGALQLMPMPLWITDNRGQIRWPNRSTSELFGLTQGVHFSRLLAPERANDARELFARKVMGASDSTVQRTALLAQEGLVDAEVVSVPLRHDERRRRCPLHGAADRCCALSSGFGSASLPRLTPRQHEVLKLLADGLTTGADRLEAGYRAGHRP